MFQQKYQSVSSAASDYRVKCFENYRVYRGAGSRAAGCRSLQPPLPCMTIDSSAAEHFVSGLSAGFVKNRQQAQFEHTHFPSVDRFTKGSISSALGFTLNSSDTLSPSPVKPWAHWHVSLPRSLITTFSGQHFPPRLCLTLSPRLDDLDQV
jgi:hypothetical protein